MPPPIAFRKTGEDTDDEILEALRDVFQGHPELFLSREEYKVLEGTPKMAEKFYTFVHLRNFPRQLCELCRLQYHYFLACGYVQDIVDMRVHKRDETGFAAFKRLLVEDYKLFPPEHRKSRKSATGTCRCGSKVYDKECILEGSGVDPSAEQEANVPEAGEVQEANVPEAGEAQEAIVPEVGKAQEANVPEVGEAQETGEAGRTQEKLWELPKKIQASKAVYNIQNNDNDCFYWTIRFATKLRRLQETCGCGRGKECVWRRI